MGKNNNNNRCDQKSEENGDAEKKENNKKDEKNNKGGVTAMVFKLHMHCECDGCSSKTIKSIRGLQGVDSVKGNLSKLNVVGSVDPEKLRLKMEKKINKKVELISPKKENPKKKDGEEQKPGCKQQMEEKKAAKQTEEKKAKEPPVVTVVLKVPLHCDGCMQKIGKFVSKTKGFMEMSIDKSKDLVTVKGAIEGKLLAEALKKKLKRPVEIVPAKKTENTGGGEKGKGGDGGSSGGNSGGKAGGKDDLKKFEQHMIEHGYMYGSGYMIHAPQLFSDENPNACSIM